MKKLNLSLFLSALLLLSGCYKDVDNSEPEEVILEIPEVIVTTTLSGHLSGFDGAVMSDYALLVNGVSYEVQGSYFSIEMQGLNKRGQTIYAYKNQKVVALGTFLPIENDINRVELVAFPEWQTNTLDWGQNANFLIGTDIEIDFSDTYFQDINGAAYKEAFSLQSGQFSDLNQPTVLGFDQFGALNVLEVLDGFYVKVQDTNGEELTIDDKHRMRLQLSNLGTKVNALYRLDEESGAWIEVAKVVKGKVEVAVKEDGYFVLVHAARGVFIEGNTIKNNNPVAYQRYNWRTDGMLGNCIGTTSGRWLTVVPSGANIDLQTKNPCGEQLPLKTINTLKNNISDVQVVMDEDNVNYQFLKVNVLDCEGNLSPQPSVHIKITDDDNDVYSFESGEINAWMAICPSFRLTAYDIDTDTEGPLLNWSTDIDDNFSYLTSCEDNSSGYTVLKIRGEEKLFPAFELEEEGTRSILKSTDNAVRLSIEDASVGTFETNQVNIYINDDSFGSKGFFIDCENAAGGCGIENCKITHFDEGADGWIRVSFSGSLWMRTIEPVEAGYFEVEGVILLQR